MTHGEMAAKKTSDEMITPASEGKPLRWRRHQIHSPQKGSHASIVGLARAPIPNKAPNNAHIGKSMPCSLVPTSRNGGEKWGIPVPASSSARRKMQASRNGVNVVSQIQWMDQYHT